MSGHARPDTPYVRSLNVSSVHLTSAYVSTDRTHPVSVRSLLAPASGRRSKHTPYVATDWTRRSNRDQRLVTYSDLRLFCKERQWHRRTVRTLQADTPPVKFQTLAQMCQPPSVSPCAHVLAYFHKHFKGVSTPLDPKCICNELEHLVAL